MVPFFSQWFIHVSHCTLSGVSHLLDQRQGQSQECTFTYTRSLSIPQPLRCFDLSQSLHSSISKVITLLLAPILSFSSPLMLRHHPAVAPPTHAAQGHPQVSKPIFFLFLMSFWTVRPSFISANDITRNYHKVRVPRPEVVGVFNCTTLSVLRFFH